MLPALLIRLSSGPAPFGVAGARRAAHRQWLAVVVLLVVGSGLQTAIAQPTQYTFAFRGVPLDQALEAFSRTTGAAVAYDPHLTRAHEAYCVAEQEPLEAVLRCILQESELDFYQLSSGTYVLAASTELPPQPGYLSGLVADRQTGTPIANAHVQLAETDIGAVTNQSGRFTFPALLPGRYVLRVSHVGYHPWQDTLRVAARGVTRTEAALQSEPIHIRPVVVDGLQVRRSARALGHMHIDADNLPIGHAADSRSAFHSINALSGVRLNDITADVYLQGGTTGDHEMRLDGVPVHLPRTTLGLIGPFSPFAIDRIAVDKAGFPAARGSQMAGVIRAQHVLGSETGGDVQVDPLSLNARLQLAPTVAGTEKVAVMTAGRVGLWSLHTPPRLRNTLAAWSKWDPFLLDAPSAAPTVQRMGEFSTPDAHFSDLHAAARIRLSPLRTLHVSAYRGGRQLTGSAWANVEHVRDRTTSGVPVTLNDRYQWRNLLGQVRYDAVLGSRTLFRVQFRGSRYRLRHHYMATDSVRIRTDTGSLGWGEGNLFPLRDDNVLQTVAVEGTIDHAWRAHHLQTGLTLSQTESAFTLNGVHFSGEHIFSNPGPIPARLFDGAAFPQQIHHRSESWRLTGFVGDRITLTDRLSARVGTRLTFLPYHATWYAEPRLALRYDRDAGPIGAWSMRTAAGVYRQFTHQTDVSVLNAGALLPSIRVWLPLDASVAVPRAYHLTYEMSAAPTPKWKLGLETYVKQYPHHLAMAYAPAGAPSTTGTLARQEQFLATARGHAYGASASARWRGTHVRLHGQYEFSRTVRRSAALFDGRSHPAPWSQPHRVELGADWMPTRHLTLSVRGRGVWKRPWGFRHIYYDYYGHNDATKIQPPFDLSRPSEHVLPPLYQFDVSLAYARQLGPAALQVRLEVLNVTDRSNVADWRLIPDGENWRRAPRHLYPRLPALAVRLGL